MNAPLRAFLADLFRTQCFTNQGKNKWFGHAHDGELVVRIPSRVYVAVGGDHANPEQFARIHRSAIVNLDRVKELQPHFNEHLVILQDGTELKLSRTRKEWLEQWLGRGA